MKKTITFFCLIAAMQTAFTQADSIDIKLQTILAEKNEEVRMDKLFNYFDLIPNYDPLLTQTITKKLLTLSEVNKDKPLEAYAISQLSIITFVLGDKAKTLEFALKALKMAEPLNNNTLMAIVYNRLAIAYRPVDRNKEIETFKQGLALRNKAAPSTVFPTIAFNLGSSYTALNKLDSALEYLQLAEKLNLQLKENKTNPVNLFHFARLYAKMNNPELANTYFTIALNEANRSNYPRFKYYANNSLSEYFHTLNKQDSAAFYAQNAVASVKNTAFFKLVKNPAKLLMNYYSNKNKDSALHYANLYISVSDSIADANKEQESYSLLFDEELRQRELKEQVAAKQQERKQNIQYALLALGIITFVIVFLMLSRKHITNTKLIQFLGVVALLLVFEFLNLLLHPFLERITHHSPALMLLALVCIAALLVPLHHKLEKWATHKLVEKNKSIRLAAAKRTIEELEKPGSGG
jgi:hypothetical protein